MMNNTFILAFAPSAIGGPFTGPVAAHPIPKTSHTHPTTTMIRRITSSFRVKSRFRPTESIILARPAARNSARTPLLRRK
jgi:hypothetical protein